MIILLLKGLWKISQSMVFEVFVLSLYASLFDLSSFEHASLFDKSDHPWSLLLCLEIYLRELKLGYHKGTISPFAHLNHPEWITIGEGSIVEAGAYIEGPCVIGKNCKVRSGAYVRENVLTGDHCVIGHTTEIKNSLLLNHAHAAHFNYLGDSILGNRVNLGAGVKCANLRLDRQPIKIMFHGERIETGMKKVGAMIGDDSQIGCGVVINPGTLIEKGVICYPNLVIEGFISARSSIKHATKPVIFSPA